MRWQIGADGTSESTQLAASKPDLKYTPVTVTVDNFDYTRAHTTVMFADACVVQDIRSLDETGEQQCSFTIQSDHAELLVILPISLATLLVGMEAAHREYLLQHQLDEQRAGKRTLKAVPDGD